MTRQSGGFTSVELLAAALVVGLVLVVLLPMAGRARNGDGYAQSKFNLSRIMQATLQYYADHAGRVPLRGCAYQNGQLVGGWDTWNVGGKNCSDFWNGQVFDESAYSRFLNPYLFGARIPRPPGYRNTGSGLTWNFNPGTPTAQQRQQLQIPVFRSPGDIATIQRVWPTPDPTISAYDDVGTSYITNMKWWEAPGLPPGFTARFAAGLAKINQAFSGANPNFVFMHDQTADRAGHFNPPFQMLGEFGKVNASMMGFADGRVDYLPVTAGALSGPGYTLAP